MEIDDVDRQILSEYLRDSRSSSREIARRVEISVSTVLARTKRLEKEGVIKGYSANLAYEKLGYSLTAVIEITVSKGKLLEVDKEVAKMPATCIVYDVTGLTDAIVIAKFKSREELSNFTKAVLAIPHVERTNTHLVLNTIKEDFKLL